jgi:hypothetical protein
MSSLKSANDLLDDAATRLHHAMRVIAELQNPSMSQAIRRLGSAHVEIFEAQYQLWALDPTLLPDLLRGPADDPQAAYEGAMRRVREAISAGSLPIAIGVLDIFLACQVSPHHLDLARSERMRLVNASNA